MDLSIEILFCTVQQLFNHLQVNLNEYKSVYVNTIYCFVSIEMCTKFNGCCIEDCYISEYSCYCDIPCYQFGDCCSDIKEAGCILGI